MKKIFKVTVLGLIGMGLVTSCTLDEVNYSSSTTSNYIVSETQYEELVNAAYMYMRPLFNSTATHCMWYGTDIYSRTGQLNDSQLGLDDYSYIDPSDGGVYNFWCKNYDIITKTNVAMTRGESLALSEEISKRRTAEMLTLRAYAYFNLVETFGGVPLILSEITSPTYDFPRDTEEQVYSQIVTDLETAINSNALYTTLSGTENFGRVGLGMAKHLLGKVLLTRSYKTFAVQNDLSRAIELFKDVIDLHPMVSSWDILFNAQDGGHYDNDNTEVIFSIRFSTNILYNSLVSSGMYQHFHPQLDKWPGNNHRGAPYWRGDLSYRAGEDYLASFDETDIRAGETYLIRSVKAGVAGTAAVAGTEKRFAIGDEVIYFPKEEWTEAQKEKYYAEHPSVYLVCNPSEYTTLFAVGGQNVVYPMIYKFYDAGVQEYTGSVNENEDPKGTRDIYVFRTAETKLLLAEAYLKNNEPGLAAAQVNDIRHRAGFDASTDLVTVTLDDILDESGRELFGESNRWMDLKRCNKLFERAYKYNQYVRRHHVSANDIDSYFLVRPIPHTEIDRSNKTLVQNPGYAQ